MAARLQLPSNIVARFLAGESVFALAQSCGLSRAPIYRVLKEAGITPRSMTDAQRLRSLAESDAEKAARCIRGQLSQAWPPPA